MTRQTSLDTGPTVRPARVSDLPDIHTMIRALSAFDGDEARVKLVQLQNLLFGPSPAALALVARCGEATVGYAGLTWDIVLHQGSQRFDIHHLFVTQTHRSKGVGTALVLAAKAVAIDAGATRLTIGTDPQNATAIGAYRRMAVLKEMLNPGPRFRVDLGS